MQFPYVTTVEQSLKHIKTKKNNMPDHTFFLLKVMRKNENDSNNKFWVT